MDKYCELLCPFCRKYFKDWIESMGQLKEHDLVHDVCPECGTSGTMIFIKEINDGKT